MYTEDAVLELSNQLDSATKLVLNKPEFWKLESSKALGRNILSYFGYRKTIVLSASRLTISKDHLYMIDNQILAFMSACFSTGTSNASDISESGINLSRLILNLLIIHRDINSENFKQVLNQYLCLTTLPSNAIHLLLSSLQEDLHILSAQCYDILSEYYAVDNLLKSSRQMKPLKPGSLRPNKGVNVVPKPAELKITDLDGIKKQRDQKMLSLNPSDVRELTSSSALLSLSWHRLLSSLSQLQSAPGNATTLLSDLLFVNDCRATGYSENACMMIASLKNLYEEINPTILLILRNIPTHNASSSSTNTVKGDYEFEDIFHIMRKDLTVATQRILKSLQIILVAASTFITSGNDLHPQNRSSSDVYTSTGTKILPNSLINGSYTSGTVLGWTQLLSDLLSPSSTMLSTNILSKDSRDQKHGCSKAGELDLDLQVDAGAMIGDFGRVYYSDLELYVVLACAEEATEEGKVEYLLSAVKSPVGVLIRSRKKNTGSNDLKQNTNISSVSANKGSIHSGSSIDSNMHGIASRLPNSASNASLALPTVSQDSLASLKTVFPDYGDLFLLASLQIFDGNIERTIDAILSENLPPQLATVDRTISKAKVGKGVTGSSAIVVGSHGKAKEETFVLEEDIGLKQSLKEKLVYERRQWDRDLQLLEREYDDDYDDQYDDAVVYQAKPGAAFGELDADAPPFIPSHQHNQKHHDQPNNRPSSRDWNTQIQEMKRVNEITKADEQEVAFWKSMRNTNYSVPVVHGRGPGGNKLVGESVETESAGNTKVVPSSNTKRNVTQSGSIQQVRHPKSRQQPQGVGDVKSNSNPRPKSQSNFPNSQSTHTTTANPKLQSAASHAGECSEGEPSESSSVGRPISGSTNSSRDGRHRHKTFDKHHQKDKAAKKAI